MNPAQTHPEKTAIIAGGGLAGLSAAVFLDQLGYQVTLIEKKQILGGRTYSFTDKKTKAVIDNGQHLMIGAYHDTLHFLDLIGARAKIELKKPSRIPLLDEELHRHDFTLRDLPVPFSASTALMSFSGLPLLDKLKLLRLLKDLLKTRQQGALFLNDLTVTDWLNKHGQSQKAQKNFWEILTLATLNDHPDQTSADGLATVLCDSYLRNRNDGFLVFPKVGLSELFVEPAEQYLHLRGHQVIRGIRLAQIHMQSGKVSAFEFSDGSQQKADIFVSALPFQHLTPLLSEENLAACPELAVTKTWETSPIVSINLFFDRPIMQSPLLGSAKTKVHWFFNKEMVLKEKAPDQSAHHIMGVISGGYEFLNKSKDDILKIALDEIQQIIPAAKDATLVHALINKEREATLSQRVGINKQRPQQQQLSNFFVVGDWTQTGLPATIESAVRSSRFVRDQLSK